MNSEKKRNQKKSETPTLERISIPNRFNQSTKRELEKKTKERRRTVQTLIPITGSDKRKEIQIGEGERGKETYLAVRRADPSPAREKKTEPGVAARRTRPRGRRGQAARRRRAHPLGSVRVGEGGSDGATIPLPWARSSGSLRSLARC